MGDYVHNQLSSTGTFVPLQCAPHPSSLVPPDTALRFACSAGMGLVITMEDWLRCANWWLLKVRHAQRLQAECVDHFAVTKSSSHPSLLQRQCEYLLLDRSEQVALPGLCGSPEGVVDRLRRDTKSPGDDIRGRAQPETTLRYRQRKTFTYTHLQTRRPQADGMQAFESDFRRLEPFRHCVDDAVPRINYNLWERCEPGLVQSSGVVDPQRWIRIHAEDAGHSDEILMFRGFVNARIGHKQRTKSTGAPYLLIVSGRIGDSEPTVTLCNQSGSLYLSRHCE